MLWTSCCSLYLWFFWDVSLRFTTCANLNIMLKVVQNCFSCFFHFYNQYTCCLCQWYLQRITELRNLKNRSSDHTTTTNEVTFGHRDDDAEQCCSYKKGFWVHDVLYNKTSSFKLTDTISRTIISSFKLKHKEVFALSHLNDLAVQAPIIVVFTNSNFCRLFVKRSWKNMFSL